MPGRRRKRRPKLEGPGITCPSQKIAAHALTVLSSIKADTDFISCKADILERNSFLQELSSECTHIWTEIGSLGTENPSGLMGGNWHHLEEYKLMISEIRAVVSTTNMTEDGANDFIRHLTKFKSWTD